jgi:hypothetical protein
MNTQIIDAINKLQDEFSEIRNQTQRKWLKTKEACAYIGISPNTLKALRIDLNPSLVMGTYYYHIDAIDDLMNTNRILKLNRYE